MAFVGTHGCGSCHYYYHHHHHQPSPCPVFSSSSEVPSSSAVYSDAAFTPLVPVSSPHRPLYPVHSSNAQVPVHPGYSDVPFTPLFPTSSPDTSIFSDLQSSRQTRQPCR